MALILEDGTKPTGANAYVDVDYADDYFNLYGNLDWSGTDDEKEAAIISATRSLDLLYGAHYLSSLVPGTEQSLLFPRYAFYDNNLRFIGSTTIPRALKEATCELALRVINQQESFPENTTDDIESEDIKIGDISISTTLSKAGQTGKTIYEDFYLIEKVLGDILKKKTTNFGFAR